MSNLHLPLTLNLQALARLLSPVLYKSEKTILRDVTRRPASLPPFTEIGGKGGKKIFEVETVINFYPAGIRAAISLELQRQYCHCQIKKTATRPPLKRSLAEDLLAAAVFEGQK